MRPSSRFTNGMGTDHSQISLAYLPPTRRQKRTALAGAAVLLLVLAFLAPFAARPLPQFNGFIPALDATIFVTDLITAGLLFAHFSLTRSRALLVLACGYLFLALIVVAHGLTFPGAFVTTENLSRAVRINFRIYLLWHIALPATLFAYIWLRRDDPKKTGVHGPIALVAACSVAGVLALVSGLTWLAIAGDELLPSPLNNFDPFSHSVLPWLVALTMLICAAAISVLWALSRSVLDQWLMVVALASMIELAITGHLGWHHFEHSPGFGGRFTLGFYAGRVLFSLLTSTVVLIALLAETTRLYAGVARASTLASAVKASQALSSEIELPKLMERVMTIAVENAGADRGLLILREGDEYLREAEARAIGDRVEVSLRQDPSTGIAYPESLIRHVIRTRQRVILDDASTANQFSGDDYLRNQQSKSVLCLPLIKQSELVGILLLENTLTSQAFTPARVAVLELLAVQAAISLDNARLYSDLQRSEAFLAQGQRISHTGSFGRNVLSEKLYWSEETYKIYELDRSVEPTLGWLIQRIHPDDRVRVQQTIEYAVHQRTGFDIEYRLMVRDNVLKYLHVVIQARENPSGELEFVGAVTDVTEQQQLMQKLQRSQHYLTEGQRLARTGSFSWCMETDEIIWSRELYRIFEFDERQPVTLERIGSRVYADDLPLLQDMLDRARSGANDFEYQHRLLMPDQSVKHIHLYGHVARDEFGRLEYVGAAQDVTEFHTITDAIANPVVVLTPDGKTLFANKVALNELRFTPGEARVEGFFPRACHPEDGGRVRQECDAGLILGAPFDLEMRLLINGKYRWLLIKYNPLKDESSKIIRWYATATDIDDQKRAEEKIRQSEKEARQLLDLSPMHIAELGPDGARLYTNRAALNYYGFTLEEWQRADLQQVLHPQDAEFMRKDLPGKLRGGSPFEYEVRLKRKDGQYRWFHYRFLSPMSDEEGHTTRWYTAGTDIDDRKLAEVRLQEENVALREEIDKASMFDEIVGTSAPLKTVLSRISKVAPTDSSVLITGETGTGKELVARSIHRRSPRSSHTFVSVNCAVIPRDLIASELFGHEKGAFTGATQRRLGRFELAEKGTIFLDEVGELPAETQIALLRVLQEREFERIGGTGPIRADVRVIAATNRDLESAIESGKFRSDLFYRLNVFPIEMPTLRMRNEDIPLLVTYFLNRYARGAGRRFTSIDKKSLDLLRSYSWPGNIRELQNVIQRSVIVAESQTFSVDESWLSSRPTTADEDIHPNPFVRLPAQEKAVIEAALRECGGRVYGPTGAAAKLGMPRSTLESKIRSLKIDKNRFRIADPSKIA